MPPCPRPASSATRWRTSPSSSPLHRSRLRQSGTSCPGVQLLPPPGRSASVYSSPHAGTHSVGVELLEYIQEQDRVTTETVSEAPGAYGGCGGGHATGAAPYETASTLAPWPSPEVGVAERHAAGPSHSSLPPNLHPVVRPFIPSGRSAPGTGLQARCGLHRCLRQGLGGPRSTGMQCRGFGRVPNCTGTSTA